MDQATEIVIVDDIGIGVLFVGMVTAVIAVIIASSSPLERVVARIDDEAIVVTVIGHQGATK
jgi:hypothetical protein